MEIVSYFSRRTTDVSTLAKRLRFRGYGTRRPSAHGEYCTVIGAAFSLVLYANGTIKITGNEREALATLEGLVP